MSSRLAWFAALYIASVIALALVATSLRWLLGLASASG